jgi:hypothetical protein
MDEIPLYGRQSSSSFFCIFFIKGLRRLLSLESSGTPSADGF